MLKQKELDIFESIKYIEKSSESPAAALLGALILAGMYYPLSLISKDVFWTASIIFISIVFFILFWHYFRFKIPKNRKRLGILISIEAQDLIIESKFKKHFVEELDRNLAKNSIADSVDLYYCSGLKAKKHNKFLTSYKRFKEELENRTTAKKIAKNIANKKDRVWKKFLDKTNRSFFIWGNVYDDGKELNVNLNGMVFHGNTDYITRQVMKKELNNIFPQKIAIADADVKRGFLISAKHFSITIKHICGMSAVIAKNYELASDLLTELLKELESNDTLPAPFEYLKVFIKETLGFTFCRMAYAEQHINTVMAVNLVDRSLFYDDKNFEALNLRCYLEFVNNRNVERAIEFADRSAKYSGDNAIWVYNKAFLLMYKEGFQAALKLYKRIFGNNFLGEEDTIRDVVKFNESISKAEPEKIQCLFVIGYILCRKQRNLIYAYNYLVDFVKKAGKKEKYAILVNIAKKYIERAEREISTSR